MVTSDVTTGYFYPTATAHTVEFYRDHRMSANILTNRLGRCLSIWLLLAHSSNRLTSSFQRLSDMINRPNRVRSISCVCCYGVVEMHAFRAKQGNIRTTRLGGPLMLRVSPLFFELSNRLISP